MQCCLCGAETLRQLRPTGGWPEQGRAVGAREAGAAALAALLRARQSAAAAEAPLRV